MDHGLRNARPKRALITGDEGFLGRHFRAELEARGWLIDGLDPKRGGAEEDCRYYFSQNPADRYDLVVHAAAVIGGREVIDGDPLATAVNLELDAAMFRWAAKAKPGWVLYFSSSAVYPVSLQGGASESVLTEDCQDPAHIVGTPDQVYGWSKLVGEALADKLRAEGVGVTVVRPFSGYGSDQDPSYPFPAFLLRALHREDPFDVWGDGEQVRDFIHVDDVVVGALALVEQSVPGPVNLSMGVGTSFNDLAQLVCRLEGYDPEIRNLKAKPEGVRYRVGDPTQLHRFYTPQVPLRAGVIRGLGELGMRLR